MSRVALGQDPRSPARPRTGSLRAAPPGAPGQRGARQRAQSERDQLGQVAVSVRGRASGRAGRRAVAAWRRRLGGSVRRRERERQPASEVVRVDEPCAAAHVAAEVERGERRPVRAVARDDRPRCSTACRRAARRRSATRRARSALAATRRRRRCATAPVPVARRRCAAPAPDESERGAPMTGEREHAERRSAPPPGPGPTRRRRHRRRRGARGRRRRARAGRSRRPRPPRRPARRTHSASRGTGRHACPSPPAEGIADHDDEHGRDGGEGEQGGDARAPTTSRIAAEAPGCRRVYPPAGPIVMVYVSEVDSDDGSRHRGQAVPAGVGQRRRHGGRPADALARRSGQLTSMVRYVVPDHTTEISIAPAPGEPELVRGLQRRVEIALRLRAVRPAPTRSGRSSSWSWSCGARRRGDDAVPRQAACRPSSRACASRARTVPRPGSDRGGGGGAWPSSWSSSPARPSWSSWPPARTSSRMRRRRRRRSVDPNCRSARCVSDHVGVPRRAAGGRDEERHQGERHGEDHPPVGAAPSHSRAHTLSGLGPSTTPPAHHRHDAIPPAPGGQAHRRRWPRSRRA